MATFKEAIITCVQEKYVTFQGRASRSEYWYFMLFVFITYAAASILDKIIFGSASGILYGISALGLFLPNLGAAVRRLHDIGRSGWWVLLGIVPIIGLVLIYFFCKQSDPETNEYGAPPVS